MHVRLFNQLLVHQVGQLHNRHSVELKSQIHLASYAVPKEWQPCMHARTKKGQDEKDVKSIFTSYNSTHANTLVSLLYDIKAT